MQKVKMKSYNIDFKYLLLKISIAIISVFISVSFLYTLFVYSTIPLITYWRTIWIETAMTTGSHGWLATMFIPAEIIDGVMDNSAGNPDIIGGLEFLQGKGKDTGEKEGMPDGNTGSDKTDDKNGSGDPSEKSGDKTKTDILGQADLTEGKADYAGYTVIVNDIEQGIVISEITGSGYRGRMMLIDDPARVFVGKTTSPNKQGLRILKMMEEYGAVAGINASGFMDHAGEGNGGEVVGLSCSEGAFWGDYVSYYGSVVLTEDNNLVVGNISAWKNYNIRDGIQFGPVLVADSKAQVKGSAGYGLQPRTAIGQREDGVILMLIIDGRDLTYSMGCTVGELADIMLKYKAVNAACCDGGASTVMAYGGEVINRNCSANPTIGRMLPNAFLVSPK